METFPVVVVGGGPVGLTTSLLLSRYGVRHVLLERHQGTSIHPKAIGLNQRTNEIWRSLGLEEQILAAAAPPRTVGRTGWYTSLAGPTPLHGREIAIRDAWGGGRYAEEYAAASPASYTMLPQIRLEPVLRAAAEERAEADIRFGHTVIAIEQDDDGVTVTVEGPEGRFDVRAAYLVGADGGRTISDALGIGVTGPTNLVDMVSAHFSADLTQHLPNQECLIYWFINPDHGYSIGSGYLYHLGPWDEKGRSQEWVFACGFLADDPERFDEGAMRARLCDALGLPDLELELHSTSHWYIQSVVADRFREGRCFLVGDAAHRIPPWGALGLNTGAQDAHNLAWKLAAVLADERLAPLLDSYEAERRPIATTVAANSLHNFSSHGGVIDAALGIEPTLPAADGWARLEQLWSGTPEGAALQSSLADAVSYMDIEFHAHGVENGFAYVEGALAPDPDASPLPADALVYRPTTRPGHHLPHVWLDLPDGRASTLDLVAPGRFALLVGTVGEQWRAALSALGGHPVTGLVDLVEVDSEAWAQVREVAADGAVLVRPDTVVAWRCESLPADSRAALAAAFTAIGAVALEAELG